MYTEGQKKDKDAVEANGIRIDVDDIPNCFIEKCERVLVQCKILKKQFVNAIAFNMYEDGRKGISPHEDEKKKFARPITTLRLFSDSRLAFDLKWFGKVNGLIYVPLPRGCVLQLDRLSFASDGAKHSVRDDDLAGKSGAIILRQVHPFLMGMAEELELKRQSEKETQSGKQETGLSLEALGAGVAEVAGTAGASEVEEKDEDVDIVVAGGVGKKETNAGTAPGVGWESFGMGDGNEMQCGSEVTFDLDEDVSSSGYGGANESEEESEGNDRNGCFDGCGGGKLEIDSDVESASGSANVTGGEDEDVSM